MVQRGKFARQNANYIVSSQGSRNYDEDDDGWLDYGLGRNKATTLIFWSFDKSLQVLC